MSFCLKTIVGEYRWYVQNEKPILDRVAKIESFSADGDELELIKARFVNIPYAHARTTWYGEMAKFVFMNLVQ